MTLEIFVPAIALFSALLVLSLLWIRAVAPALPGNQSSRARRIALAALLQPPVAGVAGLVAVTAGPGPPAEAETFLFSALMAIVFLPMLAGLAVVAPFVACSLAIRVVQFRSRTSLPRPFSRAVTALVASVFVCAVVIHAQLVGRGSLEVRLESLEYPDLPAGLADLRIAHLSDLHLSSLRGGSYANVLVRETNRFDADMIVFTGDLGAVEDIARRPEILGRLNAPLGRFAVLGNHDFGPAGAADSVAPSVDDQQARIEQMRRVLGERGFELLDNSSVVIERGAARLAVIGVGVHDPHHGFVGADLAAALSGTSDADFRILLTHNPEIWRDALEFPRPPELTLAGHTHGGQMAIELGRIRLSPAQLVFENWHGVTCAEGRFLHVSSGIGYVGLPFRIGIPPEITFLELRS